jgi:Bacterial protein of unknown function (DUF899)
VAPYVEFMGYTQPWYSVRGVEAPVGGEMGHIVCFLRDGDRVFLTYSTTGRGNEPVNGPLGLLDMTPFAFERRGGAKQTISSGKVVSKATLPKPAKSRFRTSTKGA